MFNQVILYGRLTANPEYRQTNNNAVCSFTVAIDRPKSKDGNKTADFIKCNAWNKTADMVSKYFFKGKPIMVTGRLQNNDYTDQNGVKHYSMVVLVQNVSFTINDNSQNQAVEVSQRGSQGNYPLRYQNAVQNGYNANRGYPLRPDSIPNTMKGYPQLPSEDVGNLDDFEEILNDGEIPF